MMNTPVINMAGTGHNIRQLRKAAGITVSDLQKAFGFSTPQAIYKWQRGDALVSSQVKCTLFRQQMHTFSAPVF